MKINRDIIVLASPELAKLPNWVVALLAPVAQQPHGQQPLVYYW